MRQALAEIRRALGEAVDVLRTDRRVVSLDEMRIALRPAPETGSAEFLEGIDIRDAEFEDWLRGMRSRAEEGALALSGKAAAPAAATPLLSAPDPAEGRRVLFLPAAEEPGLLRLIEDQFVDVAARSIRETYSLDVHIRDPGRSGPGLLMISVQAFELRGTHLGLRVILEDVDSQRALWSENVVTPHDPGPISQSIDHMGLCHRLMNALSDVMTAARPAGAGDPDANWLGGLALRKMFSMRHKALEEADGLLARASELSPRGVFDAWRAQLAVIQYVERQGSSRTELRERAEAYAARALAAEPMNSNVLSCLANARLVLEENRAASGELAKLSVEVNSANPLSWWALANAQLYGGDQEEAYRSAKIAQKLSENSVLKFWSDFQVALIAAVTNRAEEAINHAEISSALAPNFRPPLRYLMALYASRGDEGSVARITERLCRLEPDFTVDRMVNDTAYPVSMMRRAGLIQGRRLTDVER
ncbi:MAG: hypothetical protein AAGC57_18135 [Pseudomonadota bacterium]